MEATLIDESEHQLGELLVRANKLSARDLERAVAARQEMGGTRDSVLVQLGLVSFVCFMCPGMFRLVLPWMV